MILLVYALWILFNGLALSYIDDRELLFVVAQLIAVVAMMALNAVEDRD